MTDRCAYIFPATDGRTCDHAAGHDGMHHSLGAIDMGADIKAIEARAAAATKGPWRTREYEGEYCDEEDETRAWWLDGPDWVDREDEGLWLRERDATFIANARTDIPALLDTIAALKAEAEIEHRVTLATIKDLQDQRHLCDTLALVAAHMSVCVCPERPRCRPHGDDGVHRWLDLCQSSHDHGEPSATREQAITAYEEAQK